MNYSLKNRLGHLLAVRLQLLVMISWLLLALNGQMIESGWGWVSCPPQVAGLEERRRTIRSGGSQGKSSGSRQWRMLGRQWWLPAGRSLVLGNLWLASGGKLPGWWVSLPWLVWLWQQSGWWWPGLRSQPEWRLGGWLLWQGQRLVLIGAGVVVASQRLSGQSPGVEEVPLIGLGCMVTGREPWVQVEREAGGSYRAELRGEFQVRVSGTEPFRLRLLILFLRWLEVPAVERVRSRRTRDDRAPFVRQSQVANWFGVAQPHVSRWERYWLAGDWANLLSLKSAELLTAEVRAEIIEVCAAFPWWDEEQVHQYLKQQKRPITARQVRQTFQESGWGQLRAKLKRQYHLTATRFQPRDGWLVGQLLSQIETLLARLEAGAGLTPQEQVSLTEVKTLAAEAGVTAPPPLKALPWLLRVEQVLFGQWQTVTDQQVRCIYCGSTQVVRKSNKPRLKKYYDAQGQIQTVEVYRYYCRNRACDKGSFTHLPPGLTPYSPYRTETKLLALQMYGWGYSTYRRTGQALGVSSMTIYFWVSAWGYELLPVAALFGLVKSSGVVGVDEKYVLVPKNDKPAEKMKRWMYVYLAVDVYTYDLLHIAIYAHNDKDNALAFLLALRAKGYRPRVVVTRFAYGKTMAAISPASFPRPSITSAFSTPYRMSVARAASCMGLIMPRPNPRWSNSDRRSSPSFRPKPNGPRRNGMSRCWPGGRNLSGTRPKQSPFSTSWSATGRCWSMPSRVGSFPRPTMPSRWSSDGLISIIKTSAASRLLKPPSFIWLFLRNSTASPLFPMMPSLLFGASVPFSWPVMTSARCR
jgi:hypothetical protein